MYRNYIKSISYKREQVHVSHWTCSLFQLTNYTVKFTTLDLTVYSPSSQKIYVSNLKLGDISGHVFREAPFHVQHLHVSHHENLLINLRIIHCFFYESVMRNHVLFSLSSEWQFLLYLKRVIYHNLSVPIKQTYVLWIPLHCQVSDRIPT